MREFTHNDLFVKFCFSSVILFSLSLKCLFSYIFIHFLGIFVAACCFKQIYTQKNLIFFSFLFYYFSFFAFCCWQCGRKTYKISHKSIHTLVFDDFHRNSEYVLDGGKQLRPEIIRNRWRSKRTLTNIYDVHGVFFFFCFSRFVWLYCIWFIEIVFVASVIVVVMLNLYFRRQREYEKRSEVHVSYLCVSNKNNKFNEKTERKKYKKNLCTKKWIEATK